MPLGAPHVRPYDPSMTCSVSYPLSSVHLMQKWIILVTQVKFEILCFGMLWKPLWCILVYFGALHGRPRDPSVLNFHEVIKNMHPTHQEL